MTVVEFNHYSVMLHETIEQLNINPDGIYVDGTLGAGCCCDCCIILINAVEMSGFSGVCDTS